MKSMLVRLSVPGVAANGGPAPHPVYGGQLQDNGILGVPKEGRATISYREIAGTFADGLAANPEALQQLHWVLSGAEPTAGLEAHFAEIRRLLDHVWTEVTGRALRSARELLRFRSKSPNFLVLRFENSQIFFSLAPLARTFVRFNMTP